MSIPTLTCTLRGSSRRDVDPAQGSIHPMNDPLLASHRRRDLPRIPYNNGHDRHIAKWQGYRLPAFFDMAQYSVGGPRCYWTDLVQAGGGRLRMARQKMPQSERQLGGMASIAGAEGGTKIIDNHLAN